MFHYDYENVSHQNDPTSEHLFTHFEQKKSSLAHSNHGKICYPLKFLDSVQYLL
jgi:hypothetical protein